MRLGDVDELEERILSYYELARSGDWVLREEIKDFFDNTPTIDAVPGYQKDISPLTAHSSNSLTTEI